MLEELKEMMKEVLADKEILKLAAKIQHGTLLALIDAGFTRAEALQIVINQGSVISKK